MTDKKDYGLSWIAKETMWDSITAFFEAGFESVWGGLKEIFPDMLDTLHEKFLEVVGGVETAHWEAMLRGYENAGIIDADHSKRLLKLKDTAHPYDWFLFGYTTIKIFWEYWKLQTASNSEVVRQNINTVKRPNIPYIQEVIRAAFIAPEKADMVRELMSREGYPDEYQDLVFLANYALYNEDVIRTLFLRGELDTGKMTERMRELGYTDTRIGEIIKTWELIPGPQDLLHMVAKEAFEPDIIKEIGLDAEFPVDQVEWLNKQGLSTDWALKYWYAHWDQPSISAGFEMLHRGVITPNQLDLLFRATEIPPFWRDKLTKIAYTPYTRVDVRRMYRMGLLTPEEVVQSYRDIGYDEEKAAKMAQFAILDATEESRGLTRTQIVNSYANSMVKREDAAALLLDIGYGPDETEYMLLYTDYEQELEYQEAAITNIGLSYTKGLLEELEVTKLLGQLNLPSDRINLLLTRWGIDILKKEKLPSKTDLDKFFTKGIITADIYRLQMGKLGYNTLIINWYEELLTQNRKETTNG